MASQFKSILKNLQFQSCNRNQAEMLDYDSVFSNKKSLIFSITNRDLGLSQLQKFDRRFETVDKILSINSHDCLFAPFVDRHLKVITGLFDQDAVFVDALAKHFEIQKNIPFLKRYWQYIVIVDDGEPIKIWHNPFKEDSSLRFLRDIRLQYRKLEPEIVDQYLAKNK